MFYLVDEEEEGEGDEDNEDLVRRALPGGKTELYCVRLAVCLPWTFPRPPLRRNAKAPLVRSKGQDAIFSNI